MSGQERKFKYRLESLVKLRSAERDALKNDVERASGEVQKRTRERDDIERTIELAEDELRALYRGGADLSLDAQSRLQLYLRQQRGLRSAKQRELEEATRVMQAVLCALELKVQDTKALEKHRDRQRRQFDDVQTRVTLHAADEQWLRRKQEI